MITGQKKYSADNTLRDLIRDNNNLLMVISRFNIPFGFGDSTVGQVCMKHNVNADTFLAVCNLLSAGIALPESINLPELIAYLKRAHSSFLKVSLPRIRQHLIEAINYSCTDDVSYMLMEFFDEYVQEVKRHMEYENDVIFTYVDNLLDGKKDDKQRIADFSANHGHMAAKLQELKDLFIYHYKQAENTRLSVTLFDIIMCEKDLLAHFEVEKNLFIPAVEILEREYKYAREDAPQELQKTELSPMSLLGDREKEIIHYVARGLSNKEISEKLCISVHTVTTHRRNISTKLDIHSIAGLTIFAIIHKLVKIEDIRPS